MKNATSGISAERVDDIPLILACLEELKVAAHLDEALPRPHGDRQGLSYGQLSVVLLTFMLTEQEHRLCAVEQWLEEHQQIFELSTGWQIGYKDATDDRLGALVELIGEQKESREQVEIELGQRMIQAYELPTEVARCDTSSFSVYHSKSEEEAQTSILRFGYSKDHRPDLRQYRELLGTLDPGGIPLISDTLPGNGADDPVYVPAWERIAQVIGHKDFVFVADVKAGSQQTRAQIDHGGGIYCIPLPRQSQVNEQLKHWILQPAAAIEPLYLPGQELSETPVGSGFEMELGQHWYDPQTQEIHTWMERRLVIYSNAQGQKQKASFQRRLDNAQTQLNKLAAKTAQDHCQLKTRAEAILKDYRVSEFFTTTIETETRKRYKGRGRPNPNDASSQIVETRFRLKVDLNCSAIEEAKQLLGWRIYATNASIERLSRAQAMAYYRGQWRLERGYHRLKAGSIPALPIFLRNEQRIEGLMFLLSLALRILTLVEFRVRRQLQLQNQSLDGLYPGNPKRKTCRPSTELLLQAFHGINLYRLPDGSFHFTPLNPLQHKILALLHLPDTLYQIPKDWALPPPAA